MFPNGMYCTKKTLTDVHYLSEEWVRSGPGSRMLLERVANKLG